jgi:protein PhnA
MEHETENTYQVVDCQGAVLSSGDTVQVIKDLNVRGAKLSIRKGTVIKNIKLTADEEEVECRVDDMKGIILRTEFLRKKG